MIDETFLRTLTQIAREAEKVELISHGSIPDKVFLRHKDDLTEHEVPPAQRSPTFIGVEDFGRYLKEYEGDDPIVFYGGSGAKAFCNKNKRKDTAHLNFVKTASYDALLTLAHGASYSPRDAVSTLSKFFDNSPEVPKVINSLRDVDFTKKTTSSSKTQGRQADMGMEVENSVRSAEDIPDNFQVTVPCYQTPGLQDITTTVTVRVTIDFERNAVAFDVHPDAINAAQIEAVRECGIALRAAVDDEISIYYGSD